jgi:hypothetical protein
MADISDIYGKNYLQEAQQSKTSHLIKMVGNNVSNYEFNKQVNMSHLWNEDGVFETESKWDIIQSIQQNNKNMIVTQINKQSPEINMLPYFINEPKVEYFRVIDMNRSKIILFYITPTGMNVY